MQRSSLFSMGQDSAFRALFSPFRSPSKIAHLEIKSRPPTNSQSPAAVDRRIEATRGDDSLPASCRHHKLEHRACHAEFIGQLRSVASVDLLLSGEATQEATDLGETHRLQRASGWGLVGWERGDMWVAHVPSLWCKRRSSVVGVQTRWPCSY